MRLHKKHIVSSLFGRINRGVADAFYVHSDWRLVFRNAVDSPGAPYARGASKIRSTERCYLDGLRPTPNIVLCRFFTCRSKLGLLKNFFRGGQTSRIKNLYTRSKIVAKASHQADGVIRGDIRTATATRHCRPSIRAYYGKCVDFARVKRQQGGLVF